MPVRQSTENIAAIHASTANDPNQPIPWRSQELRIASTTLQRILRKDLGLRPYKINLTQELKSRWITQHTIQSVYGKVSLMSVFSQETVQ